MRKRVDPETCTHAHRGWTDSAVWRCLACGKFVRLVGGRWTVGWPS